MVCANNMHVSIVSMIDSFVVNTVINAIHHKLRIYVNSTFLYVPILGTSVNHCLRYFQANLTFQHMVLDVGSHLRKMFILGSGIFTLRMGRNRVRLSHLEV